MAATHCPWHYARDPFDPFSFPNISHDHHMQHPFSFEMRASRWTFGEESCCELCSIWRSIVCTVFLSPHDYLDTTNPDHSQAWKKECSSSTHWPQLSLVTSCKAVEAYTITISTSLTVTDRNSTIFRESLKNYQSSSEEHIARCHGYRS